MYNSLLCVYDALNSAIFDVNPQSGVYCAEAVSGKLFLCAAHQKLKKILRSTYVQKSQIRFLNFSIQFLSSKIFAKQFAAHSLPDTVLEHKSKSLHICAAVYGVELILFGTRSAHKSSIQVFIIFSRKIQLRLNSSIADFK